MSDHNGTDRRHGAGIEDILLAVLGLLAVPMLWWISQTWQQSPAATSVQTMEYWIALICGFVGISLGTLWIIVLLAGLGFAIALKTKNKVIGYWSGLLTPKFLQRIIISVIGMQLALGSQAYAATESTISPTEAESANAEDPFMPRIAELPSATPEAAPSEPTTRPSNAESSPSPSSPAPATMNSSSPSPSVTPQSRQTSDINVDTGTNNAERSGVDKPDLEPTPRQTTTIPMEQPPSDDAGDAPASPDAFLPEQPIPSPYIAAPNPNRATEDPTVVIHSGDSLWDIAHQELGTDATLTQIDDRWRQWWQHNVDIIGHNPHVLTPGTVLTAPPFSQ